MAAMAAFRTQRDRAEWLTNIREAEAPLDEILHRRSASPQRGRLGVGEAAGSLDAPALGADLYAVR